MIRPMMALAAILVAVGLAGCADDYYGYGYGNGYGNGYYDRDDYYRR